MKNTNCRRSLLSLTLIACLGCGGREALTPSGPSETLSAPDAAPGSARPGASGSLSAREPASPPKVTTLSWHTALPVGGDPPLPGDPVSFDCQVEDPDGDALDVTLSLDDIGGGCPSSGLCFVVERHFKAGPTPTIGEVPKGLIAPSPATSGTLTCTVRDSHGNTESQSTCFYMAGEPCP